MTVTAFNDLPKEEAAGLLAACCGAKRWNQQVMEHFPFADERALTNVVLHAWYNSNEADWLEAFTHHPKIGDVKSLTEKFASTSHLAGKEQAGVNEAPEAVIKELAEANRAYEARFGFIFIVCATGKSAKEMLRLLNDRLRNNLREELHIAMGEQAKITVLRLKKTIEGNWNEVSQVTTHVLDTSIGKPGQDITIRLKQHINNSWDTFAQGVTNADGRISDLLPPGRTLPAGNYKMLFETAGYFTAQNVKGFYPEVAIQFTISDGSHYHVPLLINPFGYSTYRGS